MLKSKTFWAGVAAIVTALAGYLTEEMTVAQAAQTALGGAVAIFLRQGIAKGSGGLACIALLVLCLGAAGCASKEEVMAYYQANIEKAKAQKPYFQMEAQPGQQITGLKSITVYPPNGPGVPQFVDPGWAVAGQAIGGAAAVAGAKVVIDGAEKIAGTVGAVAGHNQTAPAQVVRPEIVLQPKPEIVKPDIIQVPAAQ